MDKKQLEQMAMEFEQQSNALLAQLVQPLQRLAALQARTEQLRELIVEMEKEEKKTE